MTNIKTYAGYSKDLKIRLKSSSGAMFTTLADYLLANSGVVYGVSMSKDCYYAEFIRVTDADGLEKIRGSKYIQARIGNTFQMVREDLIKGRKVLFTGTGCQVNGLKKFLGKEYDNLYCMDVICHGTPSPKLWRKYLEYRERQFNSKMKYVSFRNKDRNKWDGFEVKITDQKGIEVYISRHIDPYFQFFVKNICLRPSCYECIAKRIKLSDITVADFWGIDQVAPEMNDNNGVSLIIIRNEKGQKLFDSIKSNLVVKEVNYGEAVKYNISEYKSHDRPKIREKFFNDMNRITFEKLCRKYSGEHGLKKAKNLIKLILRKINRGGVKSIEDYGFLFLFERK